MIGHYTCGYCERAFETTVRPGRAEPKHCSVKCRVVANRRFSRAELHQVAVRGDFLRRVARWAGADPHRVQKELKAAGLYDLWLARRFETVHEEICTSVIERTP